MDRCWLLLPSEGVVGDILEEEKDTAENCGSKRSYLDR